MRPRPLLLVERRANGRGIMQRPQRRNGIGNERIKVIFREFERRCKGPHDPRGQILKCGIIGLPSHAEALEIGPERRLVAEVHRIMDTIKHNSNNIIMPSSSNT